MINHSLPLITTLATALGFALIMGFVAIKLKLPTIVGYLMAGVFLGPFTPGLMADPSIAAELAEIGVMLLMFGVGLHFSWDDLLATRKIALPGALLQILVATLLGVCVGLLWNWKLSQALVFGLALSVASTVVLIRALEGRGLINTINGQIAVGWLIVEDIAMVLALVFLPFMGYWVEGSGAEGKSLGFVLGMTFVKIGSFMIFMWLIGRWLLPRLLWQITRTGSRELFTLCVIAVAVSIAFGASKLFGISLALGAFFAGMIIRESKFSRRAAEESLPFRDAFAVLFFVSVGMLFNPAIFIEAPLQVLIIVMIIVIGKSIAAALLVLAFRYPLNTALTVSASLAQIGEFSFILAGQGVELKLLSVEAQELILAGALVSIAINSFLFRFIIPLQQWLSAKSALLRSFEQLKQPLLELPVTKRHTPGHVILIGYGQVGQRIGSILTSHRIPYVIVDQNPELVDELKEQKITAIYGSGSDPSVLIQAQIDRAGMLVLATTDTFDIRQMLNIAQKLSPNIALAIRTQNEEEKILLSQEVKGAFFLSEEELAKNIGEYILKQFGIPPLKRKLKRHK